MHLKVSAAATSGLMALALASGSARAQDTTVGDFPAGLDEQNLRAWLAVRTNLPPQAVVSIGSNSIIGLRNVVAEPGVPGLFRVQIRAEVVNARTAAAGGYMSWSSDINVDCNSRRSRAMGIVNYPARDLMGVGTVAGGPSANWVTPTIGTQLYSLVSAVCDQGFQRPLAPRQVAEAPPPPAPVAAPPPPVAQAAPKPPVVVAQAPPPAAKPTPAPVVVAEAPKPPPAPVAQPAPKPAPPPVVVAEAPPRPPEPPRSAAVAEAPPRPPEAPKPATVVAQAPPPAPKPTPAPAPVVIAEAPKPPPAPVAQPAPKPAPPPVVVAETPREPPAPPPAKPAEPPLVLAQVAPPPSPASAPAPVVARPPEKPPEKPEKPEKPEPPKMQVAVAAALPPDSNAPGPAAPPQPPPAATFSAPPPPPMVVASAPPAPRPVAPRPRPKTFSNVAVQVAAAETEAAARDALANARRLLPETSDLSSEVVRADLGGRVLYRALLHDFAAKPEAVEMCERLKARGGACFIRFGWGAEAQR